MGVVIVAAGQGTRLGAGVPKQYLPLGGVPMLLRALRPFTSHPEVAHTVVVLPAADAAHPPAWLAEVLGDTLSVTAGGAERSDSVACGLAALPAACAVVLVHDAARPFVDQAIISAVAAVARTGEGAVPAIPVGDTLKQVAAGEGGEHCRQPTLLVEGSNDDRSLCNSVVHLCSVKHDASSTNPCASTPMARVTAVSPNDQKGSRRLS